MTFMLGGVLPAIRALALGNELGPSSSALRSDDAFASVWLLKYTSGQCAYI